MQAQVEEIRHYISNALGGGAVFKTTLLSKFPIAKKVIGQLEGAPSTTCDEDFQMRRGRRYDMSEAADAICELCANDEELLEKLHAEAMGHMQNQNRKESLKDILGHPKYIYWKNQFIQKYLNGEPIEPEEVKKANDATQSLRDRLARVKWFESMKSAYAIDEKDAEREFAKIAKEQILPACTGYAEVKHPEQVITYLTGCGVGYICCVKEAVRKAAKCAKRRIGVKGHVYGCRNRSTFGKRFRPYSRW